MSQSRQHSIKRTRKAKLKDINTQFLQNVKEIKSLVVYKMNKALEMRRLLMQRRQKYFDIFRFGCNYCLPQSIKCPHRAFQFRSHFKMFTSELIYFGNIFLYTLANPIANLTAM